MKRHSGFIWVPTPTPYSGERQSFQRPPTPYPGEGQSFQTQQWPTAGSQWTPVTNMSRGSYGEGYVMGQDPGEGPSSGPASWTNYRSMGQPQTSILAHLLEEPTADYNPQYHNQQTCTQTYQDWGPFPFTPVDPQPTSVSQVEMVLPAPQPKTNTAYNHESNPTSPRAEPSDTPGFAQGERATERSPVCPPGETVNNTERASTSGNSAAAEEEQRDWLKRWPITNTWGLDAVDKERCPENLQYCKVTLEKLKTMFMQELELAFVTASEKTLERGKALCQIMPLKLTERE